MELIIQKEIFWLFTQKKAIKSCISNEELVITIDTVKVAIASQ